MAPKDYYVILGIPRSEPAPGVRKAFRDLVRQHHPDRAGPEGTPRFRDIVEAYRVLSDPGQRQAYDASLHERDSARASPPGGGLRPMSTPPRFHAHDLFAAPSEVRPAANALFDRIVRNFLGPIAKAERPEPLLCDVALEPEEARRGGVLPIRIPIVMPCPSCHGAGHAAGFPCRGCGAQGETRAEVVVPLEVPPGVRPGTVLEASLDRFGVRNLWLRARIGVLE